MRKQIPPGDSDLICPMHKKTMDKVCHKCPWWYQVRGMNKNTGEELDEWRCAISLLPLMLIETADQIRQTDGTMQAFRNEAKTAHDESITMAAIAAKTAQDSVEAIRNTVQVVGSVIPLIADHHEQKLLGN